MRRLRLALGSAVLVVMAWSVVVSGQDPLNPADIPGTATTPGNIWLPAMKAPAGSPALSPADAVKTFAASSSRRRTNGSGR